MATLILPADLWWWTDKPWPNPSSLLLHPLRVAVGGPEERVDQQAVEVVVPEVLRDAEGRVHDATAVVHAVCSTENRDDPPKIVERPDAAASAIEGQLNNVFGSKKSQSGCDWLFWS
jgi:hypothetical protein